MVEKKEDLITNFKTAITSTVKSISNIDEIEVRFGNQNQKSEKTVIKLPDIDNFKFDYLKIRALADSESLKIRHSNTKVLKLHEPNGAISRKLYDMAEKIRYEKIGAREFKGIKSNITQQYNKKINDLDFKENPDKILDAFEYYLRVNFFDLKESAEIKKKFKKFKKVLEKNFKNKIHLLKENLNDQSKYNSLISEILTDLHLEDTFEDQQNNQEKDSKNNNQQKQNETEDNKKEAKSDEKQEMSIDTSVSDLEQSAEENEKNDEEIELQDWYP